jgi:rSAM/selenodomain-associated transferase 1
MHFRPHALEQAYRDWYRPGLTDLSSSAAYALRLSELLGVDAMASLGGLSLAYEPAGGSRALREAVAGHYPGLRAENVLITAGAAEAIRAAAMALVEPDQNVVVQEYSYQGLAQSVLDAGGRVVKLKACDDSLDFDLRARVRSKDEQLAFLNSPHGPSGSLVRGMDSFPGRLLVDEVYRPISLTPARRPSCVDYIHGSVAIGDLSKPLGLGGLRVGWIACRDRSVIEKCGQALDYLSCSISTLSAAIALQVLPRFEELLTPRLDLARRNLLQLARFVETHREWLTWTPPQAGYTACLRLRGGPPPDAMFARLRDRSVFLLPGAALGLPDCLRIGLCLPEEKFAEALELLGQEIRGLGSAIAVKSVKADVILYTKLPEPGHGKSRLAASLGAGNTANLARAFLEDTLLLARREAERLYIAVSPSAAAPEFASGLPDAHVYNQQGEGMGDRLVSAFERAFARGASNPILIGSDSPTLPGHLLSVAARALQTHDVVLGPAVDGGYYAIGLRRLEPRLFSNIDWSTDRVLEQTLERAESCGLGVFFLPPWYDVDTGEDIPLLRADLGTGSATRAALANIL